MARKNQEHGCVPGEYRTDTGVVRLEQDPYARGGWLVSINGVPSSHIADDPAQLEFEYMRWFAALLDCYMGNIITPSSASITHLGGGACTMARYVCATFPQARNTVVELDGTLATLARQWFALPRAPQLKIRVGEARHVTDSMPPNSRDVIIRDVFAGDTTPHSLTTLEFYQACHRAMRPQGIYLANCGDHRDLALARGELRTMRQVWRNVACIADPQMLKGRRYGNIVLLGTDNDLPEGAQLQQLTRALLKGAVPAQFKDDAWCANFAASGLVRVDC